MPDATDSAAPGDPAPPDRAGEIAGKIKPKRRRRARFQKYGGPDPYCETIEDVWNVCRANGLDFRQEMTAMMERWLRERGAAA